MGTIAQKLAAIVASKADIADALESKHAVVPATLAEYGDAIRAIPQNEAPNIANPVKFVDYDGTLLYSYGVDATMALTELPVLPERPGLTNQGWNYTLAQLKTQVQTIGKCIVGCNYITSDEKTRIYITIRDPKFSLYKLGLGQTKTYGYDLDWGDGSAKEDFGSTNYSIRSHQYNPQSYPASYVIELTPKNGGYPAILGALVAAATGSSAPSANNANTQTTALGSMIDKIELGHIGHTIGNHGFRWITSVKTINLPKCITTLQTQCLGGLDAAKGIVLPSSITSIGSSTFYYGYATEMISLPPTITSITTTMFGNCNALMELVIPYSVTSVATKAFMGCGAIQDLKFPAAVTSLGAETFNGCMSMPHAEFIGNLTSLGSKVFYNCNSLKEFRAPSTITAIPDSAFMNCSTLQRLAFEGGITSVGATAFSGCYGVRVFDFSNCTAIPTLSNVNAFANTSSTKQIIVPDALYDTWILADNWSSTTNNIKNCIVKASEA